MPSAEVVRGFAGTEQFTASRETGFVMQHGYKEMKYSKVDDGLIGMQSLAIDDSSPAADAQLFAAGKTIDDPCEPSDDSEYWNSDKWVLHVWPATPDVSTFILGVRVGSTPVLITEVGTDANVSATTDSANGYVFSHWVNDGVIEPSTGVATPYNKNYPSTAGHHTLVAVGLLGYSVVGTAATNKPNYNAVSSGAGFSWSALSAPPADHHWHYYFDGQDIGHTGSVGAQTNGSNHTCDVQAVHN